jgi:hypothetical protein
LFANIKSSIAWWRVNRQPDGIRWHGLTTLAGTPLPSLLSCSSRRSRKKRRECMQAALDRKAQFGGLAKIGCATGLVNFPEDGRDLVRCTNSPCSAWPLGRLMIVELRNPFLRKSSIINHQSQFNSTSVHLSAQQNNKASTRQLTRAVCDRACAA